jgi:hypothetical protein
MPENQNPVFTDNETITGDGTVQNPLTVLSALPENNTNSGFYTTNAETPPEMTSGTPVVLTGIQTQDVPSTGNLLAMVWASVDIQPGSDATEIDLTINLDGTPIGITPCRFVPAAPGSIDSISLSFVAVIQIPADGARHEVDLVGTSNGDNSNSDWAQIIVKLLGN